MYTPILDEVAKQILDSKNLKPILFLVTEDRNVIHQLLARGDCFEVMQENHENKYEIAAYEKGKTYSNIAFMPNSNYKFSKGPQYHIILDWKLVAGKNKITDYIKEWEKQPDAALKNLIIVSSSAPYDTIPEGYDQFVQVIDVPLIGMYEIGEMVVEKQNSKLQSLPGGGKNALLNLNDYLKVPDPYTEFLKGMSRAQIQYVLDKLEKQFGLCSIKGVPQNLKKMLGIDDKKLDSAAKKLIFEIKKKALSMDGSISFHDTEGIVRPGGMDGLETWLLQAKRILDDPQRAKKYGVKFPKGILLAGLPGSGKSLLAKYVAKVLGIPLIQFKLSSVLNGVVGGTEEKLDRVLKLIEASAPCVVWIDEIEKELPSAKDSGEGDSGVGKRCLATILTWMQENKKQCFICATANHIGSLPSELLRRGRFERKYYTFLPMQKQCVEILVTHLKQAAIDSPKLFDKTVYDPKTTDQKNDQENTRKLEAICNKAFEEIAGMERKFFTGADMEGLVQDIKTMLFNSADSMLPYNGENLRKLLVYAARKSKPYGETNFQETVEYWCDMQKNPFLNVGVPEPSGVPKDFGKVEKDEKDRIYEYIPFDFTDLRFDGKTWTWRSDLRCVSDKNYDKNMFKELQKPILQQMNLRAGKR